LFDRRHVVQAVGEGDGLLVRVRLARLLEAAVEVADLLIAADDRLAVERDDDAQRAVRGRMRRPEVQRHALEIGVDPFEARIDLRDDPGDVFLREDPALRRVVVLTQGVALKGLVGEDAAEVRVPVEADAVHVEDLALVPVEAFEDAGAGRHRLILADAHLQPHALVLRQRVELVHHVEAPVAARVVDAPEVERHRVAGGLQRGQRRDDGFGRDDQRREVLSGLLLDARQCRGELRAARVHRRRVRRQVRLAVCRRGTGFGDGAEFGECAHRTRSGGRAQGAGRR